MSDTVKSFNVNVLRLKNFRGLMTEAFRSKAGGLEKAIRGLKDERDAMLTRKAETDPIARAFLDNSQRMDLYDNLSFAHHWDQRLKNLPGELALGYEMAFVYLMVIFDSFIAGWVAEMGLQKDDRPPGGTPRLIRQACMQLGIPVVFPPEFDERLSEMRARRNVLVHRGGIADDEFCSRTGRNELRGKRLQVDEGYLDAAEEFLTEFAWTEIIPKSLSGHGARGFD